MKYKNSLLIVPVVLGAMNIAPIVVHADNTQNNLKQQQSLGLGTTDLQTQIRNMFASVSSKTYVAEQDDHVKMIGTPTIMDLNGNEIGANYLIKGTPSFTGGVSFNYSVHDLKKGDQLIFPFTDNGIISGNTTKNVVFQVGNNAKSGSLQGAGRNSQGVIFNVTKDVVGEATGKISISGAQGSSSPFLAQEVSGDGLSASYVHATISYNGKLLSTISTDMGVSHPLALDLFTGPDVAMSSGGAGGAANLAWAMSNDQISKTHFDSKPMELSGELTVENDTILRSPAPGSGISTQQYTPDGTKRYGSNVYKNVNGTYVRTTPVIVRKDPVVSEQFTDGLNRTEVLSQLKAKYPTGLSMGRSISKDGHKIAIALYAANPLTDLMHLQDTKEYVDSGATTPAEFLMKNGMNLTDEGIKNVNENEKHAPNQYYAMNIALANPAIDHKLSLITTVRNAGETEYKDAHKEWTTNKSTVAQKGQSSVQARYRDLTGKDITEAGSPAVGWPNGSEKNPDGKDEGTVQSKVVSNYVLTKAPTGAKTTNPYAVTTDFPKDGETTYEDYIYTPIGKFVTDESTAKDKLPKYANDTTDAKKIKQSYTIPYVKGKKAQGPDGKDLSLVDSKDRTKGYVAPAVSDATKDTKITYVSDVGDVTVKYVDETDNNKVIATQKANGINGDKSSYSTAEEIKTLKAKGYVLVKDGFPAGHIYNNSETFTVILKEGTTDHTPDQPNGMDKSKLQREVKQTINYVANDGKNKIPLPGVKSDVQTVKFTNYIVTNNVTGAIVKEDGWKTDKDHYDDVKSPVTHGWKTDEKQVAGSKVEAGDENSTKIVEYVPDVGDLTVKYIDKADHDKLITTQKADGINDEASTYSTDSEIKELTQKGYHLVKDGYPKGHKYHGSESFVVELDHATTTHTPDEPKGMDKNQLERNIKQTINYVANDGKIKKPLPGVKSNVQIVKYTNKIVTDNVNGSVVQEEGWKTDKDHYDDVKSPVTHGWKTNEKQVAGSKVEAGEKDAIKTVEYVPDAASLSVRYIDQDSKDKDNKIIITDKIDGINDEDAKYSTEDVIKSLTKKGYVLVKDNYPKDYKFNGDKTFDVIVKHGLTVHTPDDPKGMNPDKLRHLVLETVNYWKKSIDDNSDSNEETKQESTLDNINDSESENNARQGLENIQGIEPKVQKIEFLKTITTDNVTNAEASATAWEADDNSFNNVDSPDVPGYTADHIKIGQEEDVKATDDDYVQDVIYTAGEQKGKVTYINDSEQDESKKVLKVDGLTGKSGQKSNYSTKESIEKYKNEEYELVSDDFPKDGLTMDLDEKQDQEFEVHFKKVEKELSNTGTENIFSKLFHRILDIVKNDGENDEQ